LKLERMVFNSREEVMRKSRSSEEQMVKILREADKAPVAEVSKKYGVSEQTIYKWRKRLGLKTVRKRCDDNPNSRATLPGRKIWDGRLDRRFPRSPQMKIKDFGVPSFKHGRQVSEIFVIRPAALASRMIQAMLATGVAIAAAAKGKMPAMTWHSPSHVGTRHAGGVEQSRLRLALLLASGVLLSACETVGHVLSDPKFYKELSRQTATPSRRAIPVQPPNAAASGPSGTSRSASRTAGSSAPSATYAGMNHCVQAKASWSGDFFNVGFRNNCSKTVRAYVCITTSGHPASCTNSRKPYSGFGVMTPGSPASVNYLVGRDIQRAAKGQALQIIFAACEDPGYPYTQGNMSSCGSPF
jgi:predicted small secreted protein